MRKYLLLALSFFTLLFTACGSNVIIPDDVQPHANEKIDIPRPINLTEDWHHTEYVNISANKETNIQTPTVTLDIAFTKAPSVDVKHFQIYIDADNNPSTGFSGGQDHYEIKGADYMIEEGTLFKSTSTTAWTWVSSTYTPTYRETKSADGSRLLKSIIPASAMFTDISTIKTLNISIEPVNTQWQDTNNFVMTQAITIL